mgnify:CR=1 FL=1|tara:strand:- start:3005 stop:3310 length:306 start_codon:yes stop_codon:yes gene_type:complete
MVLVALVPEIIKRVQKNQNKEKIEKFENSVTVDLFNIIWFLINFVVGIYALYLSFQRNQGLDLSSLIVACCCPWCYVVYALAVQVPKPAQVRINTRNNNVF